MEVKCEYCGSMISDQAAECPNCGAPNTNMTRIVKDTPRTIEELKAWYEARKLPPAEVTRFFIGINYTRPKAFGIYEEDGRFIVYKNKADGSRAIRYQGTDEAYAVNEIYLKLKSEILDQKSRQGTKRASGGKRSGKKYLQIGLVTALLIGAALIGILLEDEGTYYRYDDRVYCYYGDTYYEYSNGDYTPVYGTEIPEELQSNPDEYAFDTDSDYWDSDYDFEQSDYYYDNIYEESDYSSDSSYDWDSGSSWDSGGSDWGSDW